MRRVLFAILVPSVLVMAPQAQSAEATQPLKISQTDIAGAIFQGKNAVQDENLNTDVVTFTSTDSTFQTGMYKSGPLHEEIRGPIGYPNYEFLYFISGGVTLTSADGVVTVVGAGEAVVLPRGWTGTFDTTGYSKMYVIYTPGKKP